MDIGRLSKACAKRVVEDDLVGGIAREDGRHRRIETPVKVVSCCGVRLLLPDIIRVLEHLLFHRRYAGLGSNRHIGAADHHKDGRSPRLVLADARIIAHDNPVARAQRLGHARFKGLPLSCRLHKSGSDCVGNRTLGRSRAALDIVSDPFCSIVCICDALSTHRRIDALDCLGDSRGSCFGCPRDVCDSLRAVHAVCHIASEDLVGDKFSR